MKVNGEYKQQNYLQLRSRKGLAFKNGNKSFDRLGTVQWPHEKAVTGWPIVSSSRPAALKKETATGRLRNARPQGDEWM